MAPDTSTAAPTPAAAPPDVNAQPTAPSNPALSGLVQPGPSATNVAQTLVPQYEARAGEATQKAADIANHAAGIVVAKVGAASVTPEELVSSFKEAR